MLVALDLETTGLDPKNDRIIEVAAFRITKKGEVLETFHALVQPYVALPQFITHLTGITNAALENAPSWEEIIEKVKAFIGDTPILGHSVQFDVNFLSAAGLTLSNQVLDTLELAQTLLPEEKSYSLEVLSAKYQLPHPNKHRAADDTRVAIELYQFLIEKIQALKSPHLDQIQNILKKSDWSWKTIFLENCPSSKNTPTPAIKFLITPRLNTQKTGAQKKAKDIELQRRVCETLVRNEKVILEAPFYQTIDLVTAAVQAAESSGDKMLFATHAATLLEPDPRVVTLHHPAKYLCADRLEQFLQKTSFTGAEARLLTKILLWETERGLKHEIQMSEAEQLVWHQLSAYPHLVTPTCAKETCFYTVARRNAEYRPVVVIDPELLVENIVEAGNLLPPRSHLLMDQIETFEQTATDVFTRYFAPESLLPYAPTAFEERFTILFGLLGLMVEKYAPPDAFRQQLTLNQEYAFTKEWQQIQATVQNLEGEIKNLQKNPPKDFALFLKKFQALQKALALNPGVLTWIAPRLDGTPVVRACPIDMIKLLNQKLWSAMRSFVLVSGFGSLEGQFAFVKNRLGLNAEVAEWILASRTESNESTHELQWNIHADLSDPNSPKNLGQTTELLKGWFETQKKEPIPVIPFVLTNSIKSAEQLHHKLAAFFKAHGRDLLTQNMSGGLGKITQRFVRDPASVMLIGTERLYQAILKEPEARRLTTLFIHRLPFVPPSHPVHEEQCKRLENGFKNYSLPRAVLKLKQILYNFRERTEGNEVHILDNRWGNYDGIFIKSTQNLQKTHFKNSSLNKTAS